MWVTYTHLYLRNMHKYMCMHTQELLRAYAEQNGGQIDLGEDDEDDEEGDGDDEDEGE
jgi:hypothetical protein